jgi:hypothetical protein
MKPKKEKKNEKIEKKSLETKKGKRILLPPSFLP